MSNRTLRTLLSAASLSVLASSALAATLTGVVTNRTTGKPSAGDTIAVINTARGMDELSKVTSDAQGKFQANAPDGGQILLHITHGGAEYFKSVPPGGASVDIDVYDSAAKVDGISGEALVLRAETDSTGKTLNVAENFFLQNASTPPRTQYGANTFDFYLPKGANISQSLANAPGGLPTNVDLKTIDAAAGHYAFTFPIRPGDTRFQVAYSLPYNGKQPFAVKLSVPTNDVAIMLPKSMQFAGVSQFQPINADVNALSFDAHTPPFAQPVQFTVSGTGQLPPEQVQGQGGAADQSASSQPAQATSSQRPGGGLGAPDDPEATNDPWSKYKWWLLSGLGLALVAGAAIMLKNSAVPVAAGPGATLPAEHPAAAASSTAYATASALTAAPSAGSLLQALKDELFELETDRLAGRLNDAQYAEHKAAFDVVLRRALGRIEPGPPASNS